MVCVKATDISMASTNWILCVIFIINLCVSGTLTLTQTRSCLALISHPNVELQCVPSNAEETEVRNCTRPQPVGTIASYKCKRFYTPFDESNSETQLRCDASGTWIGLRKYESYRCKEACGFVTGSNAEPLIINGVPSQRALVPWHASLYIRRNASSWTYLCGGSLVRNQVVVTAAHCLALDHFRVRDPDTFRVVLGAVSSNYVENVAAAGVQIHSVQQFFVSENYEPRNGYQADIAVIQLKGATEFSDFVIPVCLPNDFNADINVIRTGVPGEVAGFGLTENGTISSSLRTVDLNVKSNSECFNSLHRVISESQFCAGSGKDQTWQTVCNGDSGGGITFPSPVHKKIFIHGIVSSGDADVRKGLCQNYAVFTRIYPFIFWIRDVIEEISGEIARDLNQNVPYPYVFTGTETQLAVFQGLPREWENRVTTLDIAYASVNFDVVLSSLEVAKALTSISFTNINLQNVDITRGLKGRVVLPLLSSFTLDLLRDDFNINEVRNFPEPLTEAYLKSLLFFDKDYDARDWTLSSLLNLKTDVFLTVGIFKLIHLNFKNGELAMQQMPPNVRLIQDYTKNSEFVLRNLALYRCDLHIEDIASASAVVSLALDQVRIYDDVTMLIPVLKSLTAMRYLYLNPVLRPGARLNLNVQDLSKQLQHLSLADTVRLTYAEEKEEEQSFENFRIQFPDSIARISDADPLFENLQVFCCSYCLLDSSVFQKIPAFFPNLRTMVLKTDKEVDINQFLEMANLKSFYYENKADAKLTYYDRRGGRWRAIDVTETRQHHISYMCSSQHYFWTSEEDYRSRRRLKSFEREAFNSNKYSFTGANSSQGATNFPGIPTQIQPKLRSITLTSVEVSPKVLSQSISQCHDLEQLSLNHVSVSGSSRRYTFQTENLEFRLETVKFINFTFEYVYEYVNGELVAALVPFQHVGRFETSTAANTLQRLFTNINCLRLELTTATMYLFDTTMGELRACTAHIREMITSLDSTHPLSKMLINLKNIQNAYKDGILPPEWKLTGLHVIDPTLVKRFYGDSRAQVLGNLGVFRYLLQRYGKYISLASLSLTALQTRNNTFPPAQSIGLSLVRENIKAS